MSTKAKLTLGASIVLCCGTIYGVHYLQRFEKDVRQLYYIYKRIQLGNVYVCMFIAYASGIGKR